MDIENRKFERRSCLRVQFLNVFLFRESSAAKGCRKINTLPMSLCQECSGLIDFCCTIQWYNLSVSHNNRIDLQVCEVRLEKNRIVQINNEGSHRIFLGCRYLLHEFGDNCLLIDICINGDIQTQCLSINITNINTALVVEENLIGVAVALNADVHLFLIFVRSGRLNDKIVKDAGYTIKNNFLLHPFFYPFTHFFVCLVHVNQAMLATTLHKLIWLCYKFFCQKPWILICEGCPRVRFREHLGGNQAHL
mmetsp:Transcript_95423/g.150197  ORF Transcript_95423/g.150197 Transcript_95423/m.150197 type:complete len:250 (+) Transcript_95423:2788-3537(+)